MYNVSRLTPTSYPATINAVAIYFASGSGVKLGDPLTVVAGVNPSGNPTIDGIQFRTIPAAVQVLDQFNVYYIPGLTISSGDFVVGMQMNHAAGVLPFVIDQTPPSRHRSYLSTNGMAFLILDDIPLPGNSGIRALLTDTPTITAKPSSCSIPIGGIRCSITVQVTNPNRGLVQVWAKGPLDPQEKAITAAFSDATFSFSFDWVYEGTVTFHLYDVSGSPKQLLATAAATGTRSLRPVTRENPVRRPNPTNPGTRSSNSLLVSISNELE